MEAIAVFEDMMLSACRVLENITETAFRVIAEIEYTVLSLLDAKDARVRYDSFLASVTGIISNDFGSQSWDGKDE